MNKSNFSMQCVFASLPDVYDVASGVNGDDLLITIDGSTSVLLVDTSLADLQAAEILI